MNRAALIISLVLGLLAKTPMLPPLRGPISLENNPASVHAAPYVALALAAASLLWVGLRRHRGKAWRLPAITTFAFVGLAGVFYTLSSFLAQPCPACAAVTPVYNAARGMVVAVGALSAIISLLVGGYGNPSHTAITSEVSEK